MCTHLVHNPGTVDFHGALADLQPDGNHLVGLAGNHAVHDFGFPRSQAFHPADDFLFFVQGLALFEVLLRAASFFSSRASSRYGFWMKSTAPSFMASTAIGTSP